MECQGFLNCLYSFFGVIPGAVASALCVGIFTLAGIALTSRDARKRLRIQLTHEAGEKARDREHAADGKREERQAQLRREVFMDAFDGVTTAIQALARFVDLNAPMVAATEALVAAGSKVARVRAIGTHTTVLALTNLTSAIAVANIALVAKRALLDGKARHFSDVGFSLNQQRSDSNRWFEMQSQMLIQGPIPPDRFDYIQKKIELHRNEESRLVSLKMEIEKSIGVDTLGMARLLIEQQRLVSRAAVEANMAMRQELGFSGELEETIRVSLANQDEAGRAALVEYIASIESSLGLVEHASIAPGQAA
jgi:hypothetical protein